MDVDGNNNGGNVNEGENDNENEVDPLRGLKNVRSPLRRQVAALEGEEHEARIREIRRVNSYEQMQQSNIAQTKEKLAELGIVDNVWKLMDELKGVK
jgi:hypothetical protein